MALAVRTLGMEGFGSLSLIVAFAAIIGHLANVKLGTTILTFGAPRLEAGDSEGLRRLIAFAVRIELVATLAAVGVGYLLAMTLGPWFGWPASISGLGAAYMLVIAFQTRGRVANGTLRLFRRFDLIAITRTSQTLTQLLGTSALWLTETDSLAAFLAVWFAAAVIRGVGLVSGGYHELRKRTIWPLGLKAPPRGRDIHAQLWRFIGIHNINSLTALPSSQLGTLLIGASLGAADTGLFQIGSRLAQNTAHPIRALRPAIGPEVAQMLAGSALYRLRRLLGRAMGIAALISVSCLALLVLFGGPLLQLLGGHEATAAYAVMLLTATATLMGATSFPFPVLLNAAAKPGWITVSKLANTIVYLMSFFALAPTLGVNAAGAAAIAAVLTRRSIEGSGAWRLLQHLPSITSRHAAS